MFGARSTMIFSSKVLVFLTVLSVGNAFDPITLGVSTLVGGLVWKNFGAIKSNTYCRFYECCTPEYVTPNIDAIANDLRDNLFGQHIVVEYVVPALRNHFKYIDSSKKALVMSFHGVPGTGKNFVSDIIAKHLYKKGEESKFVQKYYGPINFPMESKVELYKSILWTDLVSAVAQCAQSLFIFDELDKMPAGIFEVIVHAMDYHKKVEGLDFRKAIFIFITNAGGNEIVQELSSLMQSGVKRENTKLYNFEELIGVAAYNMKGGLEKSKSIASSLIDHYVPFLPLEQRHVESCIQVEFKRFGRIPNQHQIESVLQHITFDGFFATSGCKKLNKKAGLYATMNI